MSGHTPTTEEIQLTYALSKKVPDMQQRGVRIETAYGEIELSPEDSAKVASLVKRLLERRLALTIRGAK
jgi:hypothetical protein